MSELFKSFFLKVYRFNFKDAHQTEPFIVQPSDGISSCFLETKPIPSPVQSDSQYSTPGIRQVKICATD
jgi:hypothetical protein